MLSFAFVVLIDRSCCRCIGNENAKGTCPKHSDAYGLLFKALNNFGMIHLYNLFNFETAPWYLKILSNTKQSIPISIFITSYGSWSGFLMNSNSNFVFALIFALKNSYNFRGQSNWFDYTTCSALSTIDRCLLALTRIFPRFSTPHTKRVPNRSRAFYCSPPLRNRLQYFPRACIIPPTSSERQWGYVWLQ